MEIWKDIEGWEDFYQISNLGRFRSKDREYLSEDGRRLKFKGKIMSCDVTKDGYKRAKFNFKNKSKKDSIHRLVAKAFLPNPENHPVVNHIDGNKKNNRVENLEWCTVKHNVEHSIKLGDFSRMHKVRIYNDKEDLTFTTKKRASFYLGFKYDAVGRAIKLGWKELNGYKIELIQENEDFKNNLIKYKNKANEKWDVNLIKNKIYNLVDGCILDDKGNFVVIDEDRIRFFEVVKCF